MPAIKNAKTRKDPLYRPRVFNSEAKQRFTKSRHAALCAYVGEPSIPQRILISRVVELEWTLLKLGKRLDTDTVTAHDMRVMLAAENRIRLDLAALKPAAAKPASLDDYIAAKRAREAAAP